MPGGLEKLHGLSPFLAWCLSSPLLISLTLASHPSLPYLLHLPFSVCPPSFKPHCPFPSSLPLSISQCHRCSVALSTMIPCDIPLPLFLSPLSSFFFAKPLLLFFFSECVTLTIPRALPMWLSLYQRDWAWSPWVLLAGQLK